MQARSSVPNPFAMPTFAGHNPFIAPPADDYADAADAPDAADASCTYAIVKSGPAVNDDDVEIAHLSSIEVMVLWGTNVLSVEHLTPPRSYYVGEETGDRGACDYFLPSETLGATRAPVVVEHGGSASLVILPRTTGTVDIPGTGHVTLQDLVASGRAAPSGEIVGAYEFVLPAGAKARMVLADSLLAFQVSAVNAGKPVPVGMFAQFEPTAHAYFGLSLVLHLGVVASLALFMPSMSADDAEAINRDQILMMQHMLTASADPPPEARDVEQVAKSDADNKEGGKGAQAKFEEGSMGSTLSHETGHRYGIQGPADNTDPHLAREATLRQAADFGMIGLLNAGGGGDPNAPTSPWGREESKGNDAMSALGNMWGDSIGDAFGAGGLGLSGVGEGGGGRSEGIGLGREGIGHGLGLGDGDGFGNGHGHLQGAYHPHALKMREGVLTSNGRLPAEVIQRIVRQNFGRFRLCYQDALRTNPNLGGRVAVKFAIDRSGLVSTASDAGSDLPDHGVVQCVVRGFGNLSFPEPQGGIVTVVYPLVFNPAD